MGENLEYIQMFARFPFALRGFLKHRLTLDKAKRIIRERMTQREENFLQIVERGIYHHPRSPYLSLLKMAGCEFGDLQARVKQKGLEGTLQELRAQGVYVTFEEFKGRKPIIRNGLEMQVKAHDFDNPLARRDYAARTGGSTGSAIEVKVNLDHIIARAPHEMVSLDAHKVLGAPTALWNYTFPSGTPGRRPLMLSLIGQRVERWFAPNGLRDAKGWYKYALATYYIVLALRARGVHVPFPIYTRPDQVVTVARWMREKIETQGTCVLYAGVSRALRVCIAAREAGIDLTGAVLRGGGEPVTPGKVDAMRAVGAKYIPLYAMAETSYVASGCAHPLDYSDVHLLSDVFALFTHPHLIDSLGMTVPAFQMTTLLETTPKLMLNVQMDDYGIVEERECGCAMEALGYTTHLRGISSYSKLLSEGVTLSGSEMAHLLEQVLPARFGGTPLDYQLAEEEDAEGFTRVYLLVSPRVTLTDEAAVIETLLAAMRESSTRAGAASAVWRNAQTIRIKRQEPIPTARGKLLPLRLRSTSNHKQTGSENL